MKASPVDLRGLNGSLVDLPGLKGSLVDLKGSLVDLHKSFTSLAEYILINKD